MKLYTLPLLMLLTVGCNGVKRLVDGPTNQPMPQQNNINVNDYVLTGVTTKDHQSVYLKVQGRTITVQVLRPGETAWITLERPDTTDYLDSFQLFTIPQDGVYFGKWAYKDANGATVFTSQPSAPTGTQYRIHSVAN